MQYLAEWRMTLARDHLRSDELTLAQIADRTGYSSPYAFAAAFRRHQGQPPGRRRRDGGPNEQRDQRQESRHHEQA
jgi:AraC-like DNA-binding protein